MENIRLLNSQKKNWNNLKNMIFFDKYGDKNSFI